MDSAREHFVTRVLELEDLRDLPAQAFPGDLCRVKGEMWIFLNGWQTVESATRVYELKDLPDAQLP